MSKMAPPLLVWIARILAQHDVLQPAWTKVMLALKEHNRGDKCGHGPDDICHRIWEC